MHGNPKREAVNRRQMEGAVKAFFVVLSLVLNALCVAVFMEMIWRENSEHAIIWLMERTPYALYTAAMIGSAIAALAFLFGHMAPALALGNLFFLLVGCAQHFMLVLRDDMIQPRDVAMAGEAMRVVGSLLEDGQYITQTMIIGLLVMGVGIPMLFLGVCVLKKRLIARLLGILLSCTVLAGSCGAALRLEKMDFVHPADDYSHRGFLIAFVSRALEEPAQIMTMPDDYDEQRVIQALAPYAGSKEEPMVKPNILYVMSESLFDLTDDMQLSEDPLTYFKELQQTYWGGNFLTKMFGGATASVEYEVLTGYPIEDTGVAYNMSAGSIRTGMSSVVSVLRNYGYYAEALHPNGGGFYGRRDVYAAMGFDNAHFIDALDAPPEEEFPYPSDAYVFEQLIKVYENRPKDRPWFCHAITYQNHGGYSFASTLSEVRVEEELTESQMLNATNYVNMLKLSDNALRDLIAYFDAQEEPIMIVMWGDHAPALTSLGITLPADTLSLMRYYTTPLLIYNNFGLEIEDMPETIGAHRLSAYVLRQLGMDRDAYFNYLSSDDAVNLTVKPDFVENGEGVAADPQRYQQERTLLRLLHYDRLIGEQYGEGL